MTSDGRSDGGPGTSGEMLPEVYDELRKLARARLARERAPHQTLQPTALVHEAYMRLVAQDMPEWECRSHFYGVAAHLMRQILVDHARRHRSQKRGGDDVLALDEALTSLAAVDERKCRVIELRYFGGLSVDETARTLKVSVGTIGREQRLAEAWLHRELSRPSP
jgi:RNA polymerase sigma-70 factor, ECF subfamily